MRRLYRVIAFTYYHYRPQYTAFEVRRTARGAACRPGANVARHDRRPVDGAAAGRPRARPRKSTTGTSGSKSSASATTCQSSLSSGPRRPGRPAGRGGAHSSYTQLHLVVRGGFVQNAVRGAVSCYGHRCPHRQRAAGLGRWREREEHIGQDLLVDHEHDGRLRQRPLCAARRKPVRVPDRATPVSAVHGRTTPWPWLCGGRNGACPRAYDDARQQAAEEAAHALCSVDLRGEASNALGEPRPGHGLARAPKGRRGPPRPMSTSVGTLHARNPFRACWPRTHHVGL